MSWDILVMDLPPGAELVADLPDDYQPQPLGDRSELIRRIQDAVPGADFSDPSWGQIETPDFVIELNMGREDVVDSIMLHVRGGGDLVVGLIAHLLDALGLRAIDCQSGDFFEATSAADSLAAWRAYRDRVVNGT